jgi:5-methyltetrahydropteroyltriglutamate--homocysteine methyltransferase
MKNIVPPFRADMVGSLLRTSNLKQARENFAVGKISSEKLKEIEDEEIRKIVNKQEAIGLQSVTDGEFRRSQWHFDFCWGLEGIEKVDRVIEFKGVTTSSDNVRVVDRVGV